jgi:DNA repair protein RecO (recombination protein O)
MDPRRLGGGAIVALYNTEAILIRVRDFDEADKIGVLLTPEEGKIQIVAKGARRPRNRYSGAMQLFTHVKASLFHGRSLQTLSQIEIVDSFRHLREDLVRMAYATYICELMDEMVKEKQRVDSTFLLLLTTLHLLNESEMDPEPILRAYELKLLSILGFRPSLSHCVGCDQEIGEAVQQRFSPALGGLLCQECHSEGEPVVRVGRGTIEVMKRLLEGDIRKAYILKLSGDLVREIEQVHTAYIAHRTERRIKSKEFLDTMRL